MKPIVVGNFLKLLTETFSKSHSTTFVNDDRNIDTISI